jgi:hypothetical protein
VREAAGLAAKRRIREHYQWSDIAAGIERVYFETIGMETTERPPKKPSGRAGTEASPMQKRAG